MPFVFFVFFLQKKENEKTYKKNYYFVPEWVREWVSEWESKSGRLIYAMRCREIYSILPWLSHWFSKTHSTMAASAADRSPGPSQAWCRTDKDMLHSVRRHLHVFPRSCKLKGMRINRMWLGRRRGEVMSWNAVLPLSLSFFLSLLLSVFFYYFSLLFFNSPLLCCCPCCCFSWQTKSARKRGEIWKKAETQTSFRKKSPWGVLPNPIPDLNWSLPACSLLSLPVCLWLRLGLWRQSHRDVPSGMMLLPDWTYIFCSPLSGYNTHTHTHTHTP